MVTPFIYRIFVIFLLVCLNIEDYFLAPISWHFNKAPSEKIYFLTTVSLSENGKLHKTFLGHTRQLRNFDFDHG